MDASLKSCISSKSQGKCDIHGSTVHSFKPYAAQQTSQSQTRRRRWTVFGLAEEVKKNDDRGDHKSEHDEHREAPKEAVEAVETVKAAKEAVKVPKKPSKNSVQKKANSVEQELDNQEKRIDDELKASAAKEKKLVEQGDVMEGIHEQELEEQDARAGSELNDIGEVLLQTNTVVSAVEPQRSRVQAMNMRGRGGWDYDGRSWGHNGGRWQEQDEEEGEESRRPDGGEEREGDRYIEARHGHVKRHTDSGC